MAEDGHARRARRIAGAVSFAAIALVALGSLAATSSTACATHNCDGNFQDFLPGNHVDDDTWESNSLDSKWLDFSAQRTYGFHFPPEYRGRPIATSIIYVSVDETPNSSKDPSNWAIASGNLGEFLGRHCQCNPVPRADAAVTDPPLYPDSCDDYLVLKNDTCGKYFMRAVVTFARGAANVCVPADGAGPIRNLPVAQTLDASSDAAADASNDAAVE